MLKRSSNSGFHPAGLCAVAAIFFAPALLEAQQRKAKPGSTRDRLASIESRLNEIEKTLDEISGPEAPSMLRHKVTIIEAKIEKMESEIEEATTGGEDRDTRLGRIELEVDSI